MSRSIFALVSDTRRAYFGLNRGKLDRVGMIDDTDSAFGRSYTAEPDLLGKELAEGECRIGWVSATTHI